MINLLRKLPPHAKRWVAGIVAGIIAVAIFVFWLANSFGFLGAAFDTTRSQGAAIFSFLDQNVEMAYNAFDTEFSKATAGTETEATTTATTTISATSTIRVTEIK